MKPIITILKEKRSSRTYVDKDLFSPHRGKKLSLVHGVLHNCAFWYLRKIKANASFHEVTSDYVQIKTDNLLELANNQIIDLMNKGCTPGHIYVGPKELSEFLSSCTFVQHSMVRAEYCHPYHGRMILGIPYTVLPYMSGVLVVPREGRADAV